MKYRDLFGDSKPVIAMLHLKGYDPKNTLERVKTETAAYLAAGVEAVMVENYYGTSGDCERALAWLQEAKLPLRYGVNVLGDCEAAFRMSAKYGASFVQIDSVCGHLPPEKEQKLLLDKLQAARAGTDVVLLGGVRFKYQPVRSGRSLEEDLRLGMERCDAIVVTGEGTGLATPQEKVQEFRRILGDFPLVVGAGVTIDTVEESLRVADGMIVGSYFKQGHKDSGDVEPAHVQAFMDKKRSMQLK